MGRLRLSGISATVLGELFDHVLVIDGTDEIIFAHSAGDRQDLPDLTTLVGKPLAQSLAPETALACLAALRSFRTARQWGNAVLDFLSPPGQRTPLPVAVVPMRTQPDALILLGKNLVATLLEAEDQRRERVKELTCLYRVGQFIEVSTTVDEYFAGLPTILKDAFRFPEDTAVFARYSECDFGEPPPPHAETVSVSLFAGGPQVGKIQVWSHQGTPFLKEEDQMLQEVGRMTSKALEKYEQGLQLEQSVRRLRSLVAAMPERIAMLDTNYNVLISNDPRGDDSLTRCHERYYGRNDPCEDCPVTEAIRTGQASTRKTRVKHRSLQLDAYPVLNQNGAVEAVVELVKDITKEERLQEQWIQADKLASLGQLTAGVAHEINNPTQFIKENVRIVREMLSDTMPILDSAYATRPDLRIARLPFPFFKEQIPILVQDMEVGAERIRDIVASLKQFARNNDGKLDEDVDFSAAIAASLRLTHNQLKNTAVTVLDIAPDLPRVRGNAQKIEQVLVNIIINACQAIREVPPSKRSGRSKGEIRIAAAFDPESQCIKLSIEDDGPGIRKELLKRIFDPFFTTKKDSGGTGLGLSIAYGIVREHGGTIDVESTPGSGTRFRMTFPVIEAANGE